MTAHGTSTMYEASLNETWDSFSDHLSGNRLGTFAVVSTRPLPERARTACAKSCEALGYGPDGTVFVHLEASGDGAEQPQERMQEETAANPDSVSAPATLDPKALFALLEGLDPLCVVCADRPCAEVLSACYRTPIPIGELKALFGRPSVAFDNLDGLLETDAGKQEAWAALKKLPKFHDR